MPLARQFDQQNSKNSARGPNFEAYPRDRMIRTGLMTSMYNYDAEHSHANRKTP
jgi:hypothetical protein